MTPEQLALIHDRAFTRQRAWSAAEFRELLAQASIRLLHRGQAFLLLRLLPPEMEILTLAVAPAARRQGLALALLDDTEMLARDQGVNRLFLEVAACNAPAVGLYVRAGFAKTGLRPAYYTHKDGTRDDALIMERVLTA
ncbi:GNAT family N-acetyltransferase [Boseongicola sp. H5]|uniref:GNAT family N-acetyltransferase n=1 Tax=Rhodobacterales TaxID=204455 RepID=UPI001D0B4A41|nr:GNAT family N-acetyltransferase [Boseongicola sp. H5]